jgi:hypothetical protein
MTSAARAAANPASNTAARQILENELIIPSIRDCRLLRFTVRQVYGMDRRISNGRGSFGTKDAERGDPEKEALLRVEGYCKTKKDGKPVLFRLPGDQQL